MALSNCDLYPFLGHAPDGESYWWPDNFVENKQTPEDPRCGGKNKNICNYCGQYEREYGIVLDPIQLGWDSKYSRHDVLKNMEVKTIGAEKFCLRCKKYYRPVNKCLEGLSAFNYTEGKIE